MPETGQKLTATKTEGEPVSETTLLLKTIDGHLQRGDVNAANTALDALRRVTVTFSDTERDALRDLIDVARTAHSVRSHLRRGDIEAARTVLTAALGASS